MKEEADSEQQSIETLRTDRDKNALQVEVLKGRVAENTTELKQRLAFESWKSNLRFFRRKWPLKNNSKPLSILSLLTLSTMRRRLRRAAPRCRRRSIL